MLPVALISIALAAAASGLFIVPLWISLAAMASQARLFASLNLWDYLIDPAAWLACLIILVLAPAGLGTNRPEFPAGKVSQSRLWPRLD
jgi:hypothetical protein